MTTTPDLESRDAPLVIRAQHTPGPWVAERGHLTDRIYGIKNVTRWNFLLRGKSEEAQANARLIAAAPEMYEALKMFIAWEDRTHDTSPAGQFNAAIAAARAILSKIEA